MKTFLLGFIILKSLILCLSCQTQPEKPISAFPQVQLATSPPQTQNPSEVDNAWGEQDEVETSQGKIKIWLETTVRVVKDTATKNGKAASLSSIYLAKANAKKTALAVVAGNQHFTKVNLSPNGKWALAHYEGDCQAAFEHKFQEFDFLINLEKKTFFYIFDLDQKLNLKTNPDTQGWLLSQPATLRTFFRNEPDKSSVDVALPDEIIANPQTFEQKFGKCNP